MSKHIIASSDGYSLDFMTDAEYEEYKKDALILFQKHHNILKAKYGIWASNQDKYVESVDDLNDWDSRQHV